jgi:hypothetical protein
MFFHIYQQTLKKKEKELTSWEICVSSKKINDKRQANLFFSPTKPPKTKLASASLWFSIGLFCCLGGLPSKLSRVWLGA